ncbi:MAG: hypothetical protein LBF42_01970 [Puniceicoccales bacterium]|nr:hypothetical protein [Puniceicoccales bacterium]
MMVALFVMISLIGSVFNAMMYIKLSYTLWLFANVFLTLYNFRIGEYAQTFLFAAYLIIGIFGLKNSMHDKLFSKRV